MRPVHSSRSAETTALLINNERVDTLRWTQTADRHSAWDLKGTLIHSYDTDEPRGHCVKRLSPMQRKTLCGATCMRCLESPDSQARKMNGGRQGRGRAQEESVFTGAFQRGRWKHSLERVVVTAAAQ